MARNLYVPVCPGYRDGQFLPVRISGPTYSDRALAHTYAVSRKQDANQHSKLSKRTIDTVHFWVTKLANAVPVDGGTIVFQEICDGNFYRDLVMPVGPLAAWKIPISSPQQASKVKKISVICL